MKKLIRIPIITLLLLFISCEFEEIDMGFPKTIVFSKEGGEHVVYGDYDLNRLYIREGPNSKGSAIPVEDVGYVVQYDWLTVTSPERTNTLIFTAEPSDQKTSRKLRVEGYYGRHYTSITVKQK